MRFTAIFCGFDSLCILLIYYIFGGGEMKLIAFDDVDWRDKKIAEFARYCNSISRKGSLPYQSDFDPSKVLHLLPGVAIYELKATGEIHCRLLGTGLAEQFGWDFTDHNFLDLWPEDAKDAVRESFKTALNTPCGLFNRVSGFTEKGSEISGNSVGFPALDKDGKAVRLIFFSMADEPRFAREPRRDKVVEVRTHSQCFFALD